MLGVACAPPSPWCRHFLCFDCVSCYEGAQFIGLVTACHPPPRPSASHVLYPVRSSLSPASAEGALPCVKSKSEPNGNAPASVYSTHGHLAVFRALTLPCQRNVHLSLRLSLFSGIFRLPSPDPRTTVPPHPQSPFPVPPAPHLCGRRVRWGWCRLLCLRWRRGEGAGQEEGDRKGGRECVGEGERVRYLPSESMPKPQASARGSLRKCDILQGRCQWRDAVPARLTSIQGNLHRLDVRLAVGRSALL